MDRFERGFAAIDNALNILVGSILLFGAGMLYLAVFLLPFYVILHFILKYW